MQKKTKKLFDLSDLSDEAAANLVICLIHQASYLLGRQLRRLERDSLREGGFTELLYRARSSERR